MQDSMMLGLHVLMGLSLAACTGLRAFMPLFVVGVLVRMGQIPIDKDFLFVSSDPALVVFGIATVVEIIGDKFPMVDHALDALGTVVKPIAATLLFASVMTELSPLHASVLGLLAAGSTATVMHVKKASVRLASSAGTLGFANPVVSTAEDVLCGGGIALSILMPVLAMVFVVLFLAAGFWMVKRFKPPIKPPLTA